MNNPDQSSEMVKKDPKPPKKAPAKKSKKNKEKTVEEIYKKKTQLEHILDRPDSYIGSIEGEEGYHYLINEDLSHINNT